MVILRYSRVSRLWSTGCTTVNLGKWKKKKNWTLRDHEFVIYVLTYLEIMLNFERLSKFGFASQLGISSFPFRLSSIPVVVSTVIKSSFFLGLRVILYLTSMYLTFDFLYKCVPLLLVSYTVEPSYRPIRHKSLSFISLHSHTAKSQMGTEPWSICFLNGA